MRKLYFLYRCLLAEFFTSPSWVPEKNARPTPAEIQAWEKSGLISHNGAWRLTELGKAELAIAGIDTRNPGAAEASWKAL